MLKDFFLNEVKNGIKKAAACGKLGQMGTDEKFSLIVEKPKNSDFGDFAVNVSSLARSAKIAPPMIANAVAAELPKENYSVSVVGGFINFKIANSLLAEAVAEILEKKKITASRKTCRLKKSCLNMCLLIRQVLSTSGTDAGRQWEARLQTC